MPVSDITLQSILNAPTISPGSGGWDGRIEAEFAELRGRMRGGLLGRISNVNPPLSATGDIVLQAPAGYSAFVTHMLIFATENMGTAPVWRFYVGEGVYTSAESWNDAVSLSAIDTGGPEADPLYVLPRPAGSDPFSTAEVKVPIIDGDSASPNMRVDRTTGDSSVNGRIFFFGHVWLNDD